MKKLMLFCFICLCFTASAQKIKYLSIDSVEVSREKFTEEAVQKHAHVFEIQNPKGWSYRLEITPDTGKIGPVGTLELYTYFSKITGHNMDKTIPIVIFYHQGSDPCNLSGSINWDWYNQLIRKLNSVATTHTLVVYSVADRVDKLYPGQAYYDRDNMLISFFPHHYPCGSVFLLDPNGHFTTIKGEYSQEAVLRRFKTLKANKK